MYAHQLVEYLVTKDAALDSTADVGDWAPGFTPVIVRAVGLIVTNAIGATGVLKFDKRPTAGSDSGRGDGDIAVLNLATTHAIGTVVYKDGLNIRLNPGEELVAEITDGAAASDTGHIFIVVEPTWEVPQNNADMVETT